MEILIRGVRCVFDEHEFKPMIYQGFVSSQPFTSQEILNCITHLNFSFLTKSPIDIHRFSPENLIESAVTLTSNAKHVNA